MYFISQSYYVSAGCICERTFKDAEIAFLIKMILIIGIGRLALVDLIVCCSSMKSNKVAFRITIKESPEMVEV